MKVDGIIRARARFRGTTIAEEIERARPKKKKGPPVKTVEIVIDGKPVTRTLDEWCALLPISRRSLSMAAYRRGITVEQEMLRRFGQYYDVPPMSGRVSRTLRTKRSAK